MRRHYKIYYLDKPNDANDKPSDANDKPIDTSSHHFNDPLLTELQEIIFDLYDEK